MLAYVVLAYVVLAYGEVTGHAHAIHRGAVLFRADEGGGGLAWLQVGPDGADLVHDEHDPLHLAPGVYEVIRQREWTDADEPVVVQD